MTPEDALQRLVQATRGRRCGRGYLCHCPLHGEDRHASLSVGLGETGNVVLFCHAGCNSRELIGEFKRRGLWPHRASERPRPPDAKSELDALNQRRAVAAQIWRESVPLALTPGEHYFRFWRAIPADVPLSPRLRWHSDLYSVVAGISNPISGEAIGIQTTPLSRTTGQRAGNRATFGELRHGVVNLVDAGPLAALVIGEGVETVLSAYARWQAGGLGGGPPGSAMAALSASNLAVCPLALGVTDIRIAIDRDRSGESAFRWARSRLTAADPRRTVRGFQADLPHNDFNNQAVAAANRGGGRGR